MVVMLAVLGVDTIREFAIPLMAGIIAGAWSSVCVTGGLWYLMETKIKRHSVESVTETEFE
jgi:SecD/SecF fusion protein